MKDFVTVTENCTQHTPVTGKSENLRQFMQIHIMLTGHRLQIKANISQREHLKHIRLN